MKFRKKLLSFGMIGAVASAITPICLTTSCSSNLGVTFDLTNNYYPTVERFMPEPEYPYSPNELHHIYLRKLTEDVNVFIQDYFWSKSWDGAAFDQFAFWRKLLLDQLLKTNNTSSNGVDKTIFGPAKNYYTKDYETISNLKLEKVLPDIKWGGQEWKVPFLSFTIKFRSNVKSMYIDLHELIETGGYAAVSGYVTGEINFYNVPFYIIIRTVQTYDSDRPITERVISFEPFFEIMSGEVPTPEKWQIRTNINSTISGEVSYDYSTVERIAADWLVNKTANNEEPDWTYDELSLHETIGCLFCSPFYLELIRP
ncbi:MAG: hypothetical protein ACOQNY_00680 [Mycoplasmoidaceae bacterium]